MIIRHLGYACINDTLAANKPKVFTSRTVRKDKFLSEGISCIEPLVIQNLLDLLTILEWNKQNNILFFRMSSGLLPWKAFWEINQLTDKQRVLDLLSSVGDFAKNNNMRLSFHPGEFNKLCSANPKLISSTIRELEDHSLIMDLMNLPATYDAPINIHIGGAYGDREVTAAQWVMNFKKLSTNLRSRLTIENDDKESLYTVDDLYQYIYQKLNIPIVFDFFHYRCNPRKTDTEEDNAKLAYSTWPSNIIPKMHWSESGKTEQGPDSKLHKNAHSIMCTGPFPSYTISNKPVDLMIESKGKEKALLKLKTLYP